MNKYEKLFGGKTLNFQGRIPWNKEIWMSKDRVITLLLLRSFNFTFFQYLNHGF